MCLDQLLGDAEPQPRAAKLAGGCHVTLHSQPSSQQTSQQSSQHCMLHSWDSLADYASGTAAILKTIALQTMAVQSLACHWSTTARACPLS